MNVADFEASLRLAHALLGWPVIFVLGPVALLTTKGGRLHRRAGKAYIFGMALLWLTGTWFTFAHDRLGSWRFRRDFCFNLLGAAQGFLGWRVVRRRVVDGRLAAAPLDRVLTLAQLLLAGPLLLLARRDPVVAWIGLLHVALAWGELRSERPGGASAVTPLALHLRRMVASWFHALTIVTIVQFDLPHEWKWGGGSVLALILLGVAGRPSRRIWLARGCAVVGMLLGAVVTWRALP